MGSQGTLADALLTRLPARQGAQRASCLVKSRAITGTRGAGWTLWEGAVG